MASVLAYSSPALGNLYPIFALLTELRQRGHHVAVRTLTAGLPTASALGFESTAIDPQIEAAVMTDWKARNSRIALEVAFGVFVERAAYEIEDLRAAIAITQPDVLIIDANCWGAAAVAETSGLPWLSFWPYTPFLRSRGVPPFGPGLRPRTGQFGRLRDGVLRPLVASQLENALLRPLGTIRDSVGAAPVRGVDELLRRAPLMLVATGEPLEYPHPDWGESVVLIGPCEFDPPAAQPDWLDDIDRPIVLVTTSSDRQADGTLPIVAIEALAGQPVHVVATFPSGVPADIPMHQNVTVQEFVPHGSVLDRAVCAVTHGGMGTTQKALARGIPVCVVPHGRDQFEVARRVEFSRSGTRLPARKLSSSRLKMKVQQAMSMTAGARLVAEGFRATGGVSHGADVIERRLLELHA